MGGFKSTASGIKTTVAPSVDSTPVDEIGISITTLLDDTHFDKLINVTGSGVTLNLPSAVGLEGKVYYIHVDETYASESVSVSPDGIETVGDKTSANVPVAGYFQIRSDGANWTILNNSHGIVVNSEPATTVFQGDRLLLQPLTGTDKDSSYTVEDLQHALNSTYGRAVRVAAFNAIMGFFHYCTVAATYAATMPDATSQSRKRVAFKVDPASAEPMTIDTLGELIDGGSSITVYPGEYINLESDDTDWRTIERSDMDPANLRFVLPISAAATATLDTLHILSGGPYTIDLVTAVGNAGRRMAFHGVGITSILLIDPFGGELIGSSSLLGFDDVWYMQIVSDGTNWLTETAWIPFFNAGTGEGNVFKEMNGPRPVLKTMLAGTGMTITDNVNEILFDATAAPKMKGYQTGKYYDCRSSGPCVDALAASNLILDTLYFIPFHILSDAAVTFDRIGVERTAAAGGNVEARCGIYTDVDGLPDTLLVDSGVIVTAVSGGYEAVISQALDPGVYWLAVVVDITKAFRLVNKIEGSHNYADSLTDTNVGIAFEAAYAFAALPASAPAVSVSSINPCRVQLRAT